MDITKLRGDQNLLLTRFVMMSLVLFASLVTQDSIPHSRLEVAPLVQADQVVVTGKLTDRQAIVADHSLSWFRALDLLMPPEVELRLGQPTEKCNGGTGFFLPHRDPPRVIVCKPSGVSAESEREQELTLVHEFAHLWHWGQGNGAEWLDLSHIVGGVLLPYDRAAWGDLQVERVGTIIAWGVFDNGWRSHVAITSCKGLPGLFRQLTGRNPATPVPNECANDGTYDPTASGF